MFVCHDKQVLEVREICNYKDEVVIKTIEDHPRTLVRSAKELFVTKRAAQIAKNKAKL